MSELTRIPAPDGVFPAAQYSHVVLGTGRLVAASAVQVAALVRPEFLMEIEALAVVAG
ncbi:hypothetical protein ACWD0J_13035 [Streptomyces sp. NPDC003011]